MQGTESCSCSSLLAGDSLHCVFYAMFSATEPLSWAGSPGPEETGSSDLTYPKTVGWECCFPLAGQRAELGLAEPARVAQITARHRQEWGSQLEETRGLFQLLAWGSPWYHLSVPHTHHPTPPPVTSPHPPAPPGDTGSPSHSFEHPHLVSSSTSAPARGALGWSRGPRKFPCPR